MFMIIDTIAMIDCSYLVVGVMRMILNEGFIDDALLI